MQFLLLTNVTDWLGGYTVLAASPVITLGWLNEPLWGHLALTGRPGCSPPTCLTRMMYATARELLAGK